MVGQYHVESLLISVRSVHYTSAFAQPPAGKYFMSGLAKMSCCSQVAASIGNMWWKFPLLGGVKAFLTCRTSVPGLLQPLLPQPLLRQAS